MAATIIARPDSYAAIPWLVAVLFASAWFFSRFLARNLSQPVLQIRRAAERIGDGDFATEIASDQQDELGALARAVQRLALRLQEQAQDHNVASEKLTQLSEDIRTARDVAQAATDAKSQFLQNVTHELRTPMNGIIGMITILLDTNLSEEQRDYAKVVHNSAERLLLLIDDILDYDKIVQGELEIESRAFDMRRRVQRVIDKHRDHAAERGLELRVSFAGELPQSAVGDPHRIAQVLHHLIDNAIKFTASGHVHVSVQDHSTSDESTIYFGVEDTGAGIASDDAAQIFDRFTQVNASSSRSHGGTGIGLALCRELVQKMGGEIMVASKEGIGTTFSFTLPLVRQELEPPSEQLASHTHVLVVETSPATRRVTARRLHHAGCRVLAERTSAAAIHACADHRFDLLLIDNKLPDADGPTTASLLRQLPNVGSETPIVVLIADEADGAAILEDHDDVTDVLAKPIDNDGITSLLARHGRCPNALTPS